MTSKELTYQDIVKLRKQMQENNRNFYEQPIVITYQQAIQIENECLALEQENEKLKKVLKILTQKIVIKAHRNFLFGGRHLDIANTTMKLTDEEYELLKEVLGNDK